MERPLCTFEKNIEDLSIEELMALYRLSLAKNNYLMERIAKLEKNIEAENAGN
jgi:hypothetical protein